tara:strand:- start:1162 stop:2439 length:1278 start_codon:yes stop_codon:yes gene_type:complete
MFQFPKIRELSFLVYGLSLTGISVIKFFKNNEIKNFKVWDDHQKKIFNNYRTKNLNKTLNQVDYIVLSPGISLIKNKKLKRFKKKIITDIDLFYLTNKSNKTIVVTGTNGKSTTCKLLAHLLEKNKFPCSLGGNIGTPILSIKNKKKNYVIIEASSFQLAHSKFICPNYAFFLNLSVDHLDWHGSKLNYLNSKLKIFSLQTAKHYAVVNKNFKRIFNKKKFLSRLIVNKKTDYFKLKHKIKNGYLTSIINDENMSFVYRFAKLLKITDKSFIDSMTSFKGLAHRFEIFLKKGKTIFINDSKATSFKSTQYALSSLKNIYWILGGLEKKGDKIKLSNLKKNIIKSYIIGKNTSFFENQLKGKIDFSVTRDLKNSIIQISKEINFKKNLPKSILLSPAAASFDQFDNFEERGKEFKRLCKKNVGKFI